MPTPSWDELTTAALLFVPRLVTSVVIFAAFWGAGELLRRMALKLLNARVTAPELVTLLARSIKFVLLAFGITIALGTLGVHVTALIAGLGLTGFAAGFALKDIISNALSGIMILLFRPFNQGDRVEISGTPASGAGIVSDVNLRYTVLDADGKRIFVPNSMLFTTILTVYSASSLPPANETADHPAEVDQAADHNGHFSSAT